MKTKILLALFCAGLIFALPAKATPVRWDGNGHVYDFIPGAINWFNATGFSTGFTFEDTFGHLATITSPGENDFLRTTFSVSGTNRFAWIGGMNTGSGVWVWKTGQGAEAGAQFSNGAIPTPPFNYANWGGTQPDGTAPQFAAFNVGGASLGVSPGQWIDFPSSFSGPPSSQIAGYFVEFDVPEPSAFTLLSLGGAGLLWFKRRRSVKHYERIRGATDRQVRAT